MWDILKSILLGIVEGITEWLPISSTGHMILVDEFIHLNMDRDFMDLFLVVIQLGAILAVVILFWNKIWPFHLKRTAAVPFFRQKNGSPVGGVKQLCNDYIYMDRIILWLKILVASLPAAVFGILFDAAIDEMLTGDKRAYVVSAALIVYGVLFLIVESLNRRTRWSDLSALPFTVALLIGFIQCLALIPGTSRSGSTILGAVLLGTSRVAAAEFSFFLSIPAMFGASAIKLLQYLSDGNGFTGYQLSVLAVGMIVAFAVSVFTIKFLLSYIKRHDFKGFGVYRIILGLIVLVYFAAAAR